MNFDLDNITGGALEQIESFLKSGQAQDLINTGAGVIEKQGDTNYIRAVLIAKALEEITGGIPVISEMVDGRYLISWYGVELAKAQQFFKTTAVNAVSSSGEPSPVVVDFYPVVKPMVLKYGAPALVGAGAGLVLIGYIAGRTRK